MALSVAMQKDIGEYKEKIVAGLTARSLLYLASACGVAAIEAVVAVSFGIDIEDISLPMMATVLVGFVAAYYRPLGMDTLDALPLLWRQYFGTTRLPYKTSLSLAAEAARAEEAKAAKKGGSGGETDKEEMKRARKEKEEYARDRRGRGAECAEILLPIICHAGESS